MDNMEQSSSSKWLFILIGIAILAVVVFLVFKYMRPRPGAMPNPANGTDQRVKHTGKEILKVDRKDIDVTKLPERLPTDIPTEAGALVTQNYTATTEDGRFQATRVFETSKSLDDNAKIYTDYFTKNNWKITANIKQDKLRVISGNKNSTFLTITINQNSITKAKTVEITALEIGHQSTKK